MSPIETPNTYVYFDEGNLVFVFNDPERAGCILDIKEQPSLFAGSESPVFLRAWEQVMYEVLWSLKDQSIWYVPQDFQKSCLSALTLKDQSYEALVVALRQKSRLGKYIRQAER